MTVTRPVQPSMFPDVAPDKPIGRILPSVFVGTNADLIAAVAPYYLTGSVCDLAYGEGAWWSRYKPAEFVAHDKFKLDGVDFTDLPEADDTYDAVTFDPPYAPSGGASSAAIADPNFQRRYGIGAAAGAKTGAALDALILGGIQEASRVTRRWLLVKCMEFADSGFNDVPFKVTVAAKAAGLVKHDQIVHHTGPGPGGHNIFEAKRARRHHSYLIVFRVAR